MIKTTPDIQVSDSREESLRQSRLRQPVANVPKILEFGERYNDSEILQRLRTCKILIGHQVRQAYRQWQDAKDSKETEESFEHWMVGRQIAIIGPNDMLQVRHTGRLIDVMPCDLAELITFQGLCLTFKVARCDRAVIVSELTET